MFDNPLYISTDGPIYVDQINVTCIDPAFFISKETNLTLFGSI
jgi:hypothetical protein